MKSLEATNYVSNKTMDYIGGEMKNGHTEELAEFGAAMYRDGISNGHTSVFCGLILGAIVIKVWGLINTKKKAKEMDSK